MVLKNKNLHFLGAVVFLFFLFSVVQSALATVTVTPATGGSAISADTTGGTFTSLTGPVISEGTTADIGTGTIILNVPSGFVFDTGGTAPTVLVTRIGGNGNNNRNINDLASGSTIAVTVSTTQLTITITAATSNGVSNSLTWQNVRVRPSAGTPLASGNITKTGTSSISGVTNSVTNLGTLTEVVGAKSQLVITTQPSSTATTATDFGTKPAVVIRDQFGNTVTTDSSSTITHAVVLSTQSCGGTAGSGTLTSTPTSGATVSSGVMTYTAMQYSAVESIKICFSSSGTTSALSDVVTVSAPPTTTTTTTTTTEPPTTTTTTTTTPSSTTTTTTESTTTTTQPPTPTPTPEEPPIIETTGGGTGGNDPTKIIFSGKAFPGATLGVYLMGKEYGQVLIDEEFKTQSDGSFSKEITSPVEERRLYGLLIKDKDGNPAKSKFFTYSLKFNTVVRQENLVFAPSITTNKQVLTRNELLLVSGYAAPGNIVEVLADSKVVGKTNAEGDGLYKTLINTNDLALRNYKVQARQVDSGSGKIGDVSETKLVRISSFSFAHIDFNQDSKINVSDWSIFLSNWSSSDAGIHMRDDLNGDKKIDISDLSVFLASFQLSSGH